MEIRRPILSCAVAILAVFSILAARTLAQEGAIASRALPKEDAQERSSEEELAKKLQNPVAALISVPFQLTYDWEIEDWSVPINMVVSKVTNI